jgi:hypothetical protein
MRGIIWQGMFFNSWQEVAVVVVVVSVTRWCH